MNWEFVIVCPNCGYHMKTWNSDVFHSPHIIMCTKCGLPKDMMHPEKQGWKVKIGRWVKKGKWYNPFSWHYVWEWRK